ncbi:MAG: hypothetical protein R6V85_16040 [Polyangia bacterium]
MAGTLARFVWMLLPVLLAAGAVSGCRTTIGGREVVFRPARGFPSVSHEDDQGRRDHFPAFDPEGETLLLMMRGRW